eukprot:SM000175S03311  [mRNA]  locus=s175:257026:269190:+ [translate_table: standard]
MPAIAAAAAAAAAAACLPQSRSSSRRELDSLACGSGWSSFLVRGARLQRPVAARPTGLLWGRRAIAAPAAMQQAIRPVRAGLPVASSGGGASTGAAVVWFRNDLRVHDNEALVRAHRSAEHLVPLYCLDPRLFGQTYTSGLPKTGELRAQFMLDSVADLRASLQARGSDLIIRYGKPEEVVPKIAHELKAHTVFVQRETCDEEIRVEKGVAREMERLDEAATIPADGSRKHRVRLEYVWGHTMYHLDDLPFPVNQTPDVYTQFRKAVESRSEVRKSMAPPGKLAPMPHGDILNAIGGKGELPKLEELGLQPRKQDERGVMNIVGGETAALERLKHYFWDTDCIREYKHTRNGMLGADYSTKFSPWLAAGCLSPRFICEEVKRYESQRVANDSTYWVLFELIWRDYFRFVALKYGNSLFHLAGPRSVKGLSWSRDTTLFEAWKEGRTGYPLVDANMRELAATGFMSNRGRQIVCSFFVRDMGMDWRMGAEWFETCLLDYDPCSNYGNWTYGAGVGNDPREDRYFSIPKQAQNYDPQGEYVAHWIPELKGIPPALRNNPHKLSPVEQEQHNIGSGGYPLPIVPLKFKSTPGSRGAPGSRGRGRGGRGGHHGGRADRSYARSGTGFAICDLTAAAFVYELVCVSSDRRGQADAAIKKHSAVINQLSSLAPRGSISRCMESYRHRLTLQDFSLIFREFAQRGDSQRALRLFKYMQRQQWCKPNEHVYTIMIGIMGRDGLVEKASELFEDMPRSGVPWNVYSFTALINAYGRNGLYDWSLDLLARMKHEQVAPNLITYNTVLNACAKGGLDWEGLLDLFAQMRYEGIQSDIITYNTLLGACAARGLVDGAGMVFRTMLEAGVSPDLVTYTTLVEPYADARRLGGVAELLYEMVALGTLPDVAAYNILIDAYGKQGLYFEAGKTFAAMQDAGVTPNVVTYSTLLDAYGKHGQYDKVHGLFRDMKASGITPNLVTYNTLIGVFGHGGFCHEAVGLFDDMVAAGVVPDALTYASLFYACGRGGLHEDAMRIYRSLSQSEVVPTSEMFIGIIQAYGAAAMYEEAMGAFQGMQEAGCTPDQETYNALLELYARGGLYDEAGAVVFAMHDAGFVPNVWTFNSLIQAFGKGGQYDEAIEVFRDMQEVKRAPNEQTNAALLAVYCLSGHFDEARAQYLEMQAAGFLPDAVAYALLLSICARRSRWGDAKRILDEMEGARSTESHRILRGLLLGEFDDRNAWQQVEFFLDQVKMEGIADALVVYDAFLEALWYFGQKRRATRFHSAAQARGISPIAIRRSRLMWSIDVHRTSAGAALTVLLSWLADVQAAVELGEELPRLFGIITKWGEQGPSKSEIQHIPVRKAVLSLLAALDAPFQMAPWNLGRIVSQRPPLAEWIASGGAILAIEDEPLPELVAGITAAAGPAMSANWTCIEEQTKSRQRDDETSAVDGLSTLYSSRSSQDAVHLLRLNVSPASRKPS